MSQKVSASLVPQRNGDSEHRPKYILMEVVEEILSDDNVFYREIAACASHHPCDSMVSKF
jgi:hypothetical protein